MCYKSDTLTDDATSEYEWKALMHYICNVAIIPLEFELIAQYYNTDFFGVSSIVVGCPLRVEQV